MKRSWTNRECILATSLVWMILIILIGGYYRNGFRMVRGIYQIATLSPQPVQKVLEPLNSSFAAALKSMYDRQPQMGTDGNMHKLDGITKIWPEEGMYIYELCRNIKPQRTLEIGFAYGFSTLYFIAAIKANGKGIHVVIDPFEITDWHGIGLKKAQELGMHEDLRFIEEKSVFALPGLAREGMKYDIIFIDGSHLYENVLLDFTLSDQICAKEGFIIFHDTYLPSIRKVISFIERNRSDYLRHVTPVANLGIFQKVGDDSREWTYFVDF